MHRASLLVSTVWAIAAALVAMAEPAPTITTSGPSYHQPAVTSSGQCALALPEEMVLGGRTTSCRPMERRSPDRRLRRGSVWFETTWTGHVIGGPAVLQRTETSFAPAVTLGRSGAALAAEQAGPSGQEGRLTDHESRIAGGARP